MTCHSCAPVFCLGRGGLQKLTCIPADLHDDSDAAKRAHYGASCRRLHWLAPCTSSLRYGIYHYLLQFAWAYAKYKVIISAPHSHISHKHLMLTPDFCASAWMSLLMMWTASIWACPPF